MASRAPTADEVLAERLYGTPKATAQSAAPAAGSQGAADTPAQPVTEAAIADRMFDRGDPVLTHGDAMRALERSAMEDHLSSPADAQAAAAHWGGTFQAFRLNSTESAQLADVGVSAFRSPPSPETVDSWVKESRAVVLQEVGADSAHQALQDAQLMIEKFGTPELRDMLESTGLGNHPAVVRIAIQKAREMRAAGKL